MSIPTWFYGHEPLNPFAGSIAKHFANALREDGLPARSAAGVIFLPSTAGTVQEIFDSTTPNHYGSRGEPSPMVLVGRDHWTRELPARPLLRALAAGRPMESRITLVDTVEEAAEALARLPATQGVTHHCRHPASSPTSRSYVASHPHSARTRSRPFSPIAAAVSRSRRSPTSRAAMAGTSRPSTR